MASKRISGIRHALVLASGVFLAACNLSEPDVDEPPPQLPGDAPLELVIAAERWEILIENAQGLTPRTEISMPGKSGMTNTRRVHQALIDGALTLVALRNDVCREELLGAIECRHVRFPDWVTVYEAEPPELYVLQERSEWLARTLPRFVELRCTTARGGWRKACEVD